MKYYLINYIDNKVVDDFSILDEQVLSVLKNKYFVNVSSVKRILNYMSMSDANACALNNYLIIVGYDGSVENNIIDKYIRTKNINDILS